MKINLAIIALEEKEFSKALYYSQQLLAESLRASDHEGVAAMLWLIGIASTGLGCTEEGLRLYASGTAWRERLHAPEQPPYILDHHCQLLAPARRQVSPERLAVLEAEGQALSLEQAVTIARAFTP